MELKKLSLCNHVFLDFIKQIKEDGIYLIKIDDRWFVSAIEYVSVRSGGKDNPHCWDVEYGWSSHQLSHRSNTRLDENWQEIYEIIDKEIIKNKTKKVLREKAEIHDDDSSGYLPAEDHGWPS